MEPENHFISSLLLYCKSLPFVLVNIPDCNALPVLKHITERCILRLGFLHLKQGLPANRPWVVTI